MGIKASVPIATAAGLLNDPSAVKYKSANSTDLLRYLNEAQTEIVRIDLQANAVRENFLVTPGTKQSLSSDDINSLGLITVVRNMGRTGSTIGDIVRKMDRAIMDQLYPGWHTATAKEDTKFYIYDPKISKLTFDIYPPAVSTQTHYLEIIHGEIPAYITNAATEDIMDDEYFADIVDYILFRAKSIHAEYAGKSGEAMAHLVKFEQSVRSKMNGNTQKESR